MDWMRFWWQFMTDPTGSEPGFWDIVHLLAFADTHLDGGVPEYEWSNTGPVWENLLGALEDASSGLSSHASWYEDITSDHGVYNGE